MIKFSLFIISSFTIKFKQKFFLILIFACENQTFQFQTKMSKLNLVENDESKSEVSVISWNKVAYAKDGHDLEKMHHAGQAQMIGGNVRNWSGCRKKLWQTFVFFSLIFSLLALVYAIGFTYNSNKSLKVQEREIYRELHNIYEFLHGFPNKISQIVQTQSHNSTKHFEHIEQLLVNHQWEAIAETSKAQMQLKRDAFAEKTRLEQQLNHFLEHQNAKIELVDNFKNGWNTSTGPNMAVHGHTVKNIKDETFHIIRAVHGFPTNFSANPDGRLGFKISYAEFTIDEIKAYESYNYNYYYHERVRVTTHGNAEIFLASDDFTKTSNDCDKSSVSSSSFFYGIRSDGQICKSDQNNKVQKSASSFSFKSGDKIGCGVLVILKSATAEAANCTRCQQPTSWVFFTKNGEIFDTPQRLPTNVPSQLFPTIAFYREGSVTANFGQSPFVYGIPPAKDLCVGKFCQKPSIF